jgi:hypothetical protein
MISIKSHKLKKNVILKHKVHRIMYLKLPMDIKIIIIRVNLLLAILILKIYKFWKAQRTIIP